VKTVRLVTLGCAKNQVDSEEIAGVLRERGYTLDPLSERVDAVIINTCGFLQTAKWEGAREIRKALTRKARGTIKHVVVAGCLSQREGSKMAEAFPKADAMIGVGQMARFGEILDRVFAGERVIEIGKPSHLWADVPTRARSDAPWSAYLKISEGCDHQCSFCTIPSFRGPHQSKPIERLMSEARFLAASGAREINLIAQDVTQYGYDIYGKFTLPELLGKLNEIEGVDWIRMLYFYPNRLTDELIETMCGSAKVLPYIDIPLQHAHPEILRKMKRPWDGERYLRLFERLRKAMPECAIRTTFIVGFPGETDEHFECLLQFMREAKLDRVGAFSYSCEAGTPAAEMRDQVAVSVKRERYHRLMSEQQAISLELNRKWIGRRLDVLLESEDDGQMIGRSFRDAPEIDGVVFVDGMDLPGEMIEVEITGAEEYDLRAKPVGRRARTAPKSQTLRMAVTN